MVANLRNNDQKIYTCSIQMQLFFSHIVGLWLIKSTGVDLVDKGDLLSFT